MGIAGAEVPSLKRGFPTSIEGHGHEVHWEFQAPAFYAVVWGWDQRGGLPRAQVMGAPYMNSLLGKLTRAAPTWVPPHTQWSQVLLSSGAALELQLAEQRERPDVWLSATDSPSWARVYPDRVE